MNRVRWVNTLLVTLIVVLAAVAIFVGATDVGTPMDLLTGTLTPSASTILWEIRVPRVVAAILAGALIALAGTLSQGVFANPIAEPTLIGTTASAALGAVLVLAITAGAVGQAGALVAAFVAALGAALLTLRIAANRALGIAALVVVGVAVAAMANGLIAVIAAIADDARIRSVGFWTSGTLAFADWNVVLQLGTVLVVVLVAMPMAAHRLDLLSFGDIQVRLLGHDPQRIRLLHLTIVGAVVAVATVTIGSLAFLGLAAPHIARVLVGHSHREVIPTAALIGATLLIAADTIARTLIAPAELPISVVTALIGAPVLVALMIRRKEHVDDRTA